MAITRRQFLKCSGLATAGGIFGPSFFGNSLCSGRFAETIGDRYVVVIYLDGGNDGLNTVTPADNGLGTLRTAYDAARDANAGRPAASALAGPARRHAHRRWIPIRTASSPFTRR